MIAAVVMAAGLTAISEGRKQFRKSISSLPWLNRIASAIWTIYEAIVDQEFLKTRHGSIRVLWATLLLSSCVIIHGMFTNLMSTDLVRILPKPVVENVKDLFSEPFDKYPISIFNSMWAHQFVKGLNPDSELVRLRRRLDKIPFAHLGHVILNPDGYSASKVLQPDKDRALLIPLFLWETFFAHAGCMAKPEVIASMIRSEAVGQGLITTFAVQSNITHIFYRYMQSRARRSWEAHLMTLGIRSIFTAMVEGFDVDENRIDVVKCLDKTYDEKQESENVVMPFPLMGFRVTFVVLIIGVASAWLLIIVELGHTKSRRSRNLCAARLKFACASVMQRLVRKFHQVMVLLKNKWFSDD